MIRFYLQALLAAILCCYSASAQDITGQIGGVVTDTSGAIVRGATVHITNTNTGVRVWQGQTNSSGAYAATLLPVGNYNLTFEATGFRPIHVDGVGVSVSDRRRVDAVFQPGDVKESITVNGGNVSNLESDTSYLGTEVGKGELQSLPMPNRDVLNLLAATPGVSSGGDPSGVTQSQLSFNGSRTLNSEFTVGGISVVSGATGGTTHYPSPDALQEFKVVTSAYSAEYGRSAGATVNMIVANGINQFHGGLYEYFRNELLNANSYFRNLQNIARPVDRRNQFGGKFSGPVLLPKVYKGKDRTFFFFNYEGQRTYSPTTQTSTIPDTNFRAGDFSISPTPVYDPTNKAPFPKNQIPSTRFDPAAVKMMALLPKPNSPGSLDTANNRLINNYVLSESIRSGIDATTTRIDHNINDKTRLYGYFDESKAPTAGTVIIPGYLDPGTGPQTATSYLTSVSLTELFSPSLIAELRFGFSRFHTEQVPPSAGIDVPRDFGIQNVPLPYSPTFNLSNWTTLGTNQNTLATSIDNNYQTAASATWVKGDHVIKAGFQLRKNQFNVYNPGTNLGGSYTFSGTLTSPTASSGNAVNDLADFLLGLVQSGSYVLPQPITGRRNYNLGIFIQDDWRATSRLTLNFGLREEYESPLTMSNHMYSRIDPYTGQLLVAGQNASESLNLPTPRKNLAPRTGLAFRLNSKTVIRSGFGIFFGQNFSNLGGVVTYTGFAVTQSFGSLGNGKAQNFSLSQGMPLIAVQNFQPLKLAAAATVANPLTQAGVAYGDMSKLTNSLQWNFGFQREITRGLILDTNYVGTRGEHLSLNLKYNNVPSFQIAEQEDASGAAVSLQAVRPFPTVSSLSDFFNVGSSMYHSLQIRATQQLRTGLSFQSSYTLSKSTDDGSGIYNYSQPNGLDAGQFPNISRRIDHSVSAFDRKQSVSIALRYTTGGNKWLRGFSLSPLFTGRTGLPQTISQTNLYPDVTQQRPNAIAPLSQIYTTQLTSSGTAMRYLVPTTDAAFPLAPTGPLFATINGHTTLVLPASIGTLGRYVLRAPGDINLNLALSRQFQIREKLRFTLRVDSYNSMNHTNFNGPSVALSVAANSAGQAVFNSPSFGLITSARTARITQLIARFDF